MTADRSRASLPKMMASPPLLWKDRRYITSRSLWIIFNKSPIPFHLSGGAVRSLKTTRLKLTKRHGDAKISEDRKRVKRQTLIRNEIDNVDTKLARLVALIICDCKRSSFQLLNCHDSSGRSRTSRDLWIVSAAVRFGSVRYDSVRFGSGTSIITGPEVARNSIIPGVNIPKNLQT